MSGDRDSHPGEGRFEFVQPPDIAGITVAFIEKSCKTVRMVHETYSCSMVQWGARDWECNGQRYRSAPGQVLAWQPGDFHQCLEDSPTSQRGMLIPPGMMHEIARDIGFDQEPLNVKERQVRHRPLYDAHRRFYRSLEESSTRLERQTLFLDAVRHLLRSCFGHSTRRLQPRPESRAVELVRREIDERHAENLGLEELSKLAGLNRFHLLRTFHAQVGCTPHAYLIDRRLARARELLRRGATPSEAAVDVGFADQSHLTRHFKRFFGVTPALYGKS